jgi:hypothetical protein
VRFVPHPAWLAAVVSTAALAVVLLGNGVPATAGHGRSRPCLGRITPATSVFELARHFGRPTGEQFHGGALIDVWVSRTHQWTVIRYIHPQPRPTDQP